MKKHILTSLLTVIAASCFAIDTSSAKEPLVLKPAIPEQSLTLPKQHQSSNGLLYVKMDVANSEVLENPAAVSNKTLIPGVGVGYRRGAVSAIDVSVGLSTKKEETGSESIQWSFPKMTFLRYLTPNRTSSFYFGAGLNWGGVYQYISADENIPEAEDTKRAFVGLSPLACIGYELNHNTQQAWRSFFEFEVSQPAISVMQVGELPGPIAQLSVGLGF
ncbi:MAG: hypothetical protein Q8L98_03755 [Chlamydiales bacterium]|nr:hypothetical protein [Chlamydiales bacterium]